jgi:hypothetical protein
VKTLIHHDVFLKVHNACLLNRFLSCFGENTKIAFDIIIDVRAFTAPLRLPLQLK